MIKILSVRGKKIDKLIAQVKNENSSHDHLGKLVLKKVNNSIIVSKER